MATFDDAIDIVLQREGGFSHQSADPGGYTNYGITLGFLQSIQPGAEPSDIINMTRDQAIDIYRNHYWRTILEQISSQAIATKAFDMSVNMGNRQADKNTQTAINALLGDGTVTVDGSIGPATIAQLNSAILQLGEDRVLNQIRQAAWDFYQRLIAAKPQLAEFENGWRNRAFA